MTRTLLGLPVAGFVAGVGLFFVATFLVSAATAGPNYPSTGASVAGIGTIAWGNPGNITADDSSVATSTLPASGASRYLQATGFGFAIPANAVIDGIEVSINRFSSSASSGNSIDDTVVSLIKAGSVVGDNKATGTDWSTSASTVADYGDTDDLWGTTWTAAQVNAANFGVALAVENESGSSSRTASVDYFRVTVHYTIATAVPFTETFGASDSGTVTGWVETGAEIEGDSSGEDSTLTGPSSDKFAKIDEDGYICRTFDATGLSDLELSYFWKGDDDAEGSDDGIVEYRVGGCAASSPSWTTLDTHALDSTSWSGEEVISLPGAVDNSLFSVRFRGDSSSGNEYFRVDQIEIVEATLDQTITFGALAGKTYGDADFDVSASASSGLTVTFGASGNCTMTDADTVHLTGSGSCTITASQAGNGTYNAAPNVDRVFSIAQAGLTITGIDIEDKTYDGTIAATITGTAALAGVVGSDDVNLSPSAPSAVFADENVGTGKTVTLSGYALGGTTAGYYTLTQPSGFTADILTKALTAVATGINKVYDGGVAATVILDSPDKIGGDTVNFSYSLAEFDTPDVGAAKNVSVYGIAIGGADAPNYALQNTQASTTANITPDLGLITVDDVTVAYDGTPKSVSITGDTTPSSLSHVITYNGSPMAPTNAGVYSVLAAIVDTNYAGTDSATLTITALDQAITFDALADKTFDSGDFDVSATSTSGLPPTFSVTAGNCAMADANTVHMLGSGTCSVVASQSGDGNYNAATPVERTFTINPAVVTISTLSLPNNQINTGYSQTVAATSTYSTDVLTWSIASGTLPTGLSLNSGIGAITGTTTALGTFEFDIEVSGSDPSSVDVKKTYTIVVSEAPVETPAPTPSSGGGGQPVGSGPTAPNTQPNGSVLGASVGPEGEVLGASTSTVTSTGGEVLGAQSGSSCPNGVPLSSYLRRGDSGAQAGVLQTFLNTEMASTLTVDGIFGASTEDVVKAFQLKYASEILAPWGLTEATGYVYKLTQRKINLISCPGLEIPMPALN